MRRAILAFVATVAGLVVLLSFKTAGTKSTNGPVALSGTTPSDQTTASDGAAPSDAAAPSDNPVPSDNPAQSANSTPPSKPTQPSSATPTKTAASSGTKTVTGSSVPVTEGFRTFGNVQVKVTVTNGKITKLVAVDYPNGDPRSFEISQYSIPVLGQEVLQAQGTNIDIVSGATYTTEAYAQSVQAALDQAKS